jgi:uncharacterized protein
MCVVQPMRSNLDHLPEPKQRELARIVTILHEEFDDALALGKTEWKKRGRILKIILFGSYARGNWVDEPHTMKGYKSDFDLLIIVNNRKLTDFGTYWYKARDRLRHDRGIKTPVSFIVHSRREVNDALRKGQYFFSDIRKEGIVLYELDGEPLAEPKLLTSKEQYKAANEHFEEWFPSVTRRLETFRFEFEKGHQSEAWRKDAAFTLHQATERSYHCVLLTLTNYSPPTHDLNDLRGLSEGLDRRLVDAWPRDMQRYRAWFNKLCEAYVKARYSKHYEISEEALLWLGECAEQLQALVAAVCQEQLAKLKARSQSRMMR